MEQKLLGVIGAGAMGTAIIRGLLRGGHIAKEILVYDPDPVRRQTIEEWGLTCTGSNLELIQRADGIMIAVKPQILPEILSEVGADYPEATPLLSVAAGITTAYLEAKLPPGVPVVRAMPNTPAFIGEGVIALSGGKYATMDHLSWAHELLTPLGKVIMIRESLMDAVTGLSGSGPAYVYLFIESMIEAGVLAGIPRDIARDLVYTTVYGSMKMAIETKEHPAKLREQVTSPGGTTAAALAVLERNAFRANISEAISAAAQRSRELGKE